MREQYFINEINKMKQYIQQLEGSVRLAFTGQEVRGAALVDLLLTKPSLAESEVHELITKLVSFLSSKLMKISPTDERSVLVLTEEDLKTLEVEIKAVLFKGPMLTNDEMTLAIGNTITKMQQQAEEAAKKVETEIIKPSTEQVQAVTNNPEVPPQA